MQVGLLLPNPFAYEAVTRLPPYRDGQDAFALVAAVVDLPDKARRLSLAVFRHPEEDTYVAILNDRDPSALREVARSLTGHAAIRSADLRPCGGGAAPANPERPHQALVELDTDAPVAVGV